MSQTPGESKNEFPFPSAKKMKYIAETAKINNKAEEIRTQMLLFAFQASETGLYSCKRIYPWDWNVQMRLNVLFKCLGFLVCFNPKSHSEHEIVLVWEKAEEGTTAYEYKNRADAYNAEPERVHREIYEEIIPQYHIQDTTFC